MSREGLLADGGENDEDSTEEIAASLEAVNNAEELRRLAAHLDGVSRTRGARKSETAMQIAEQAPEAAEEVAGQGRYAVTCSCGLSFTVDDAESAEEHAGQHKSENPTHFPQALDLEAGEDEETKIYG